MTTSNEDCFEDKLKYLQHTLGFAKLECIKALRQTNEDIVEAVQLLNIMQKSKSIDKYQEINSETSATNDSIKPVLTVKGELV